MIFEKKKMRKELKELIEKKYRTRLNKAVNNYIDNSLRLAIPINAGYIDKSKLQKEVSEEIMKLNKKIASKTNSPAIGYIINAYAYAAIIEDRIYTPPLSNAIEKPIKEVINNLTEKTVKFVAEDVKGMIFEKDFNTILAATSSPLNLLIENSYVPVARELDLRTLETLEKLIPNFPKLEIIPDISRNQRLKD